MVRFVFRVEGILFISWLVYNKLLWRFFVLQYVAILYKISFLSFFPIYILVMVQITCTNNASA